MKKRTKKKRRNKKKKDNKGKTIKKQKEKKKTFLEIFEQSLKMQIKNNNLYFKKENKMEMESAKKNNYSLSFSLLTMSLVNGCSFELSICFVFIFQFFIVSLERLFLLCPIFTVFITK